MMINIIIGAAIGLIVGVVNFYLLRVIVRLSLNNAGRVKGVFVVIFGYAIRYLFIFAVVYYLAQQGRSVMAVTILAVLALMTMAMGFAQKKTKAGICPQPQLEPGRPHPGYRPEGRPAPEDTR